MIPTLLPEVEPAQPAYGLREGVLSRSETLAQSISAIAPSTSAALTVPLVYALAGEGTCIAYLLALVAMVLIALCIVVFARDSASPGSLYVYTHTTLSPFWASVTAWSLCFAYLTTASSVIGGFVSFAYALLGSAGPHVPAVLLALLAAGVAMWIAYKDIQISARVMLYTEAISVLLIVFVLCVVLCKHGPHFDTAQLRVGKMSFSGVRLGVVLAIFSFVGFESATSLGSEAREPLKTIPQAVLWSTLLSGLFFVGCAYSEVLGFRSAPQGLAESAAPMRFLSVRAGMAFAGPVIDAGVLVSMFAATLAFVIALARLLMLMARHQLVATRLGATSVRHHTPALGGFLVAVGAVLPVVFLLARGATGAEVYGWMGSLAVFGYLTTYSLVAVAMVVHRRRQMRLGTGTWLLAGCALLAMVVVALSTLFPVPPAPYRYFPAYYVAFMLVAGAAQLVRQRPAA